MAGILSLKRRVVTRSPEREALALALNEVVGVKHALEQARTVAARATSLRDQASERFTGATAAAESAREGHAAAMLAAAQTGEAVALSGTSRELRHAAADARADLDAANTALALTEAARDEAEASFLAAAQVVADRAAGVIGAEAPRLVAEVREAQRALFRKLSELTEVYAHMPRDTASFHEARIVVDVATSYGLYPDEETGSTSSASSYAAANRAREAARLPWRQAREALITNPDAPLPEQEG